MRSPITDTACNSPKAGKEPQEGDLEGETHLPSVLPLGKGEAATLDGARGVEGREWREVGNGRG